MKAQILRGTKEQIAEIVLRIDGEVCEAVVFVEDPVDRSPDIHGVDIFAEMEPFTVKVGRAEYAREAIYAPVEGE